MKTYLVIEEYCNDYEYDTRYFSFTKKEDAVSKFNEIKRFIEKDCEDLEWEVSSSEDEYYQYQDGEYCVNHARTELLEMETV